MFDEVVKTGLYTITRAETTSSTLVRTRLSSLRPGQCVQDVKLLEQLISFSVLSFSPLSHAAQQHEGSEAFSPKFLTVEHLFEHVWQLCTFFVHVLVA